MLIRRRQCNLPSQPPHQAEPQPDIPDNEALLVRQHLPLAPATATLQQGSDNSSQRRPRTAAAAPHPAHPWLRCQ
jgi:hypothetical protein